MSVPEPESRPRLPIAWTFRWRLRLAASLAAAASAWFINSYVYHNTPVTTDENSYVFQARTFLEGHVSRPCPPVGPVFRSEMVILHPKVGWLSRYPPAHALWLLPGVWLGQPRIMVSLAAGVAVWFISGSAMLLGGSALIACLVLLVSPYFQFINGTLLSHTSGLAATAVMWWAYVGWQRDGRTWQAALAGVAWAFLFLNRTYTAALLAVPLGMDALVRLARQWRCGRQWLATVWFGVMALAGIGAFLGYNALAVGNPLTPTHAFYGDEAAVGFTAMHTWRDGLNDLWGNVRLLDRWLLGCPGTLLLVLAAVVVGWSPAWSPVCVGCVVAVMGGYTAFSAAGFNSCGPYYYFETLPFLATLLALAGARLERWRPGRRLVGLLLVAAMVAGVAFMKHEARRTRKERAPDVRAQQALREAPRDALVFVGGFHETVGRQLLANPLGVRSEPLIVQNWGPRNYLVARAFPNRRCYELRPGMDHVQPVDTPFRKVTHEGGADDWESRVGRRVKTDDGEGWMADAAWARAGWLARGREFEVLAGQYRGEVRIDYGDVSTSQPIRIDLVDGQGRAVGGRELTGSSTQSVVAVHFAVPAPGSIELRIWYGGSGRATFRSVRIEEL